MCQRCRSLEANIQTTIRGALVDAMVHDNEHGKAPATTHEAKTRLDAMARIIAEPVINQIRAHAVGLEARRTRDVQSNVVH
jgi:hypothetical protein